MGTLTHVPGAELRAAVLTIARQRDWERQAIDRWPILADLTRARIATHEHDLGAIAGAFGFRDAAALVDACQATPDPWGELDAALTGATVARIRAEAVQPAAAGPDDDGDEDEDEAAPFDGVWAAPSPLATDPPESAEPRPANLAEPMGGWEPRS